MLNWFFNRVTEGVNDKLFTEIDNLKVENEMLQEVILKLQTLPPTPEDNVALQTHKEAHDTFNSWKSKVIDFAEKNGMSVTLSTNLDFNKLLDSVPHTKLL